MEKNYYNSVSSLLDKMQLTQKLSFRILLLFILVCTSTINAQIALRGAATTSTSTNTNITIAKPTGVILGDIMLVNIAKGGNKNTNPSSAGWTLIDGRSLGGGTDRNGAVLYKIATTVEPANYTFALGAGTNSASGGIVAFSGVDNSFPFDVGPGTISVQGSQTAVVANGVTTVTANTAIVMFGQAAGNNPSWNNGNWNTTSPGALNELFDIGQGSNDQSSVGAAWLAKPNIGPTGNGSATLSFAERNGGILLALRPACTASVAPTSISGTTSICNGTSTTLTAVGGTIGMRATVQWFTGSCGGTSVGTGTSITVSPIATTTYFVRYSGSGGCNTTTCATATVTVNPAPVITTQPSTPAAVCAGSGTRSLTVIATGATTYQWKKGGVNLTNTGIYSGVNTATLTVTNPGILENGAVYTVEVGNAASCTVTSTPRTLTVTAVPAPLIEFDEGAGDTIANISVCGAVGPAENDLDIVVGTDPGGSATYQWQVSTDGGATWINGPGPTSTATQYVLNPLYVSFQTIAGVYNFRIIITNNGCTGVSNVATMFVSGVSTLTAGVVGANQIGCTTPFNPAVFTQTTAPTGGTGSYTYQWESSTNNINFTYIGGATGVTYDVLSITQTTYYRRVTISGGCSSTGNTVTVTVAATSITTAATATNVCFSNAAQTTPLTYSATTGSPATYSIVWNALPVNSFIPVTNALLPASPISIAVPANTAAGTYTGTITVNNGTCTSANRTFTVTVNPLPTAPTISASGPTTFCSGGNVTLTSSAGTTYLWSTGATTPSISPTVSGNYSVQVTNINGCLSSSSAITTVTINPLPAAPTITVGGPTTFCLGGNVSLTSSVGSTYLWSNGSTSASISAISTGNYSVRVTDGNGCQSPFSPATAVTVNALPSTPTISLSGPTTFCSGGNVTLTSSIGNSYLWSTSETTPSITSNSTGSYSVQITNINGCQSNFSVATNVSVNSISALTVVGDQSLLCGNIDPATFTTSIAASGSGAMTYQWESNTTGCGGLWSSIATATNQNYDSPNILQTSYFRLVSTSTLNSVSCSVTSNCLNVVINSKVWNGVIDANWADNSNWFPNGTPIVADCVVIPDVIIDPIISGTNYNPAIDTLTIINGGNLTVNASNSLTVTDFVNVNTGGQFLIKDSASLVQINNTPNVGNVNIERITQPMYRFDYTYWGCPVTLASGYTLGMLSPLTLSDKYFSWIPTVANSFGNWFYESAATVMDPIKGYIIRAPQTFSYTSNVKVPYTANFIGTPNNGDILCPIYFGGLPLANNNDKYNLLGNPYASAVDAELFLSDPANVPIIDGTIYFWTHNSPPSALNVDPFYGDFVINYAANDYASWNKLGGTGTTSAAGSGGTVPSGFIASGQGFFTKSNGTTTSGDPVVFKNSMRIATNNNQFFRSANVAVNSNRSDLNTFEKHRIWLNLVNNGGSFNQIIVGYAEGASNSYDRDFDGVRFTDNNSITLYSIIPDKHLVIQGRALPFSIEDQIPLGYKSTLNDTFSIRIDHFDGLFENQNIYLEDRLLNTIHDLKLSPYVFTSEIGTFDNRFVLRYNNITLSTGGLENSNNLISNFINGKLEINSSELIHEVDVFDISGKLIQHFNLDIPRTNFESHFSIAEGIYILKVKLQNGGLVSQKLIYKK